MTALTLLTTIATQSNTLTDITVSLRFLTIIIAFWAAYEAWQIVHFNSYIKTPEIARKVTSLFVMYGMGRLIALIPDVYLGGLLSNAVNVVILTWFYCILHYERIRLASMRHPSPVYKISSMVSTIIDDLKAEASVDVAPSK
jgi:CDP-diglyceride synthetase